MEALYPRFAAHSQRAGGFCSVAVSGELDLATGPILADEIARCEGPNTGHVFVDLARVTFIDTDGIRFLCQARQRSDDDGRHLVLAAVSPVVQRLLRLTGLRTNFAYAHRTPAIG